MMFLHFCTTTHQNSYLLSYDQSETEKVLNKMLNTEPSYRNYNIFSILRFRSMHLFTCNTSTSYLVNPKHSQVNGGIK